jgi:general stress protein 26
MDYKEKMKQLDNVEFLKERADKIKTAMLTTYTTAHGFHSRPMGTADLDAEGNFWFFTNEYSEKVAEISLDNKVSLTYADHSDNTYLSIKGVASVVDDKAKMKQLWNPYVEAFFPDGINDPKLTLLKIHATDAEYWETTQNKVILAFNFIKATVMGDKFDAGKHGTLQL